MEGPVQNRIRRAVFLDRDGVINRAEILDGKPYPPRRIQDFVILPEVAEACAMFKQHGFLLVVATNQPDVGRGAQTRENVEAMHRILEQQLPIDRIEVCYDAGDAPSVYRKPAPGMLIRVAVDWNVDLHSSFMVGDRWRDIDCGNAAGCTAVLIDHGYNETLRSQPAHRTSNLLDAARWICHRNESL
jgi:D-glycero-D-manno-heptose 1,7-bisphosphate phosphatase